MVFMRHKLQYIIQYYITSGLLVVVSWVSRNEISEREGRKLNYFKMKYQHQVVAAFLLILGQFSDRSKCCSWKNDPTGNSILGFN